ncbi:MAG: hypothetical protein QXE31_06465 [Candidatus Woesearchaeota archaeon]
MVKANVDLILDYLKFKKSASVPEIAKATKINQEDIKKSVEFLEEDGVVKIDYNLTTPIVYLIEKKDKIEESNVDISKNKVEEVKIKEMPSPQIKEINLVINEPKNDNKILNKSTENQPNINIILPNINNIPYNNVQKQETMFSSVSNETINRENNEQNNIQRINFGIANIQNDNILSHSNIAEKKEFNSEIIIDKDPFINKPDFDLSPPILEDNIKKENKIVSSNIKTLEQEPKLKSALFYTSEKEIDMPEYLEKDSEKIDFLIEFGIKKIENYDYKDLNVIYRKAYNLFRLSNDLSPNERFLLSERLNDLFNRIKRIYMIEETAV